MLKEAEHVDHPDSETIKQALTELEDVVSKVICEGFPRLLLLYCVLSPLFL